MTLDIKGHFLFWDSNIGLLNLEIFQNLFRSDFFSDPSEFWSKILKRHFYLSGKNWKLRGFSENVISRGREKRMKNPSIHGLCENLGNTYRFKTHFFPQQHQCYFLSKFILKYFSVISETTDKNGNVRNTKRY